MTARLLPMRARDPHEPGRVASSLELFFDLVFVVAVSVASVELHHQLSDGHVLHGIAVYLVVFFGIWWAWMNFTWFATSFATDDWLYRLLVILQMSGVLVLAAGIGPAFEDDDFTLLVLAYVVMRVAMVAQWLRASRSAGVLRTTTLVYAWGIAAVQVLWLLMLLLPRDVQPWVIPVLAAAELAVPVVAERAGPRSTPWHPHHITERYGLFTLILLGESLLASANAIIEAFHEHEDLAPLIELGVLTMVVTAALWWIYFWPPHHAALDGRLARSLRYGYVHYVVFAAAGALSAGVEVEIDALQGHTALSDVAASFTVTVPVAVFMLGVWWIAMRDVADRAVNVAMPVGALLVLLDPVLPVPVTLTALVLVIVVVVLVRHPPLEPDDPGA